MIIMSRSAVTMSLSPLTQHAVNTPMSSFLTTIATWWANSTSPSMRLTTFSELRPTQTWNGSRINARRNTAQRSWKTPSNTIRSLHKILKRPTMGSSLGWACSTGTPWTTWSKFGCLPFSEKTPRTPWASSTTSSRAASLEKWTTQKHGILNGIKVGHEPLRNKWRIL